MTFNYPNPGLEAEIRKVVSSDDAKNILAALESVGHAWVQITPTQIRIKILGATITHPIGKTGTATTKKSREATEALLNRSDAALRRLKRGMHRLPSET